MIKITLEFADYVEAGKAIALLSGGSVRDVTPAADAPNPAKAAAAGKPAADKPAPVASDAVLDGWWGNGGISKDGRNLTAVGRTEALAAIGYNAPMMGAKLRWAYLPEQAREKLAAMHAQGWEPAAAPAPTAASAAPTPSAAPAGDDPKPEDLTKAVVAAVGRAGRDKVVAHLRDVYNVAKGAEITDVPTRIKAIASVSAL